MKEDNNLLLDIIEWFLRLPILKIFKPLFDKYKAFFMYCILGVISTIANIYAFVLCDSLGMQPLIANVMAWVISTIFSFYIFGQFQFGFKENDVLFELIRYAGGRVAALLVEELFIFVFIVKLNINKVLVKTVGSIFIAILNYFISKIFVFK